MVLYENFSLPSRLEANQRPIGPWNFSVLYRLSFVSPRLP